MAIHLINKPISWTPLEAIHALKKQQPKLTDTPITYAGRLDPMADGLLLILSGEDRYQKEALLTLPKTYRATFLFGYTSDSHDILGLVTKKEPATNPSHYLYDLIGTHLLPFPHYSSYKVQGKPLHWWTSQNRLQEIQIPTKAMTVLEVSDVSTQTLSPDQFWQHLHTRITAVRGDFRQQAILKRWQSIRPTSSTQIHTATLSVTSGTYIRSLAHLLGQQLGTGCLLWSLTRTSVGPYHLNNAISLQTD